MELPKPKRNVNSALLAILREQACIACGNPPPNEVDHIKTRGSGGDDTIDNLWPQCRQHHHERHQLGLRRFAAKYPNCLAWLKDHRGHDEIVTDVIRMMKLN